MSVLLKLWLFKRYINQNNHDEADIRTDEGLTLEMSSARSQSAGKFDNFFVTTLKLRTHLSSFFLCFGEVS